MWQIANEKALPLQGTNKISAQDPNKRKCHENKRSKKEVKPGRCDKVCIFPTSDEANKMKQYMFVARWTYNLCVKAYEADKVIMVQTNTLYSKDFLPGLAVNGIKCWDVELTSRLRKRFVNKKAILAMKEDPSSSPHLKHFEQEVKKRSKTPRHWAQDTPYDIRSVAVDDFVNAVKSYRARLKICKTDDQKLKLLAKTTFHERIDQDFQEHFIISLEKYNQTKT